MPFRTDHSDAIFAEINLKPEFICLKFITWQRSSGDSPTQFCPERCIRSKKCSLSAHFLSVEKEEKAFFAVICDGEYAKVKMFKVGHVISCSTLLNGSVIRCRISYRSFCHLRDNACYLNENLVYARTVSLVI